MPFDSFLYSSGQLYGTVIALPLTGAILGSLGWQAVFYLIGLLAVLHSVAWIYFVHEAPSLHPSISRAELNVIQGAIGNQRDKSVSISNVIKVIY
jgi:predicted MFS family arabinose efflux permease